MGGGVRILILYLGVRKQCLQIMRVDNDRNGTQEDTTERGK